MNADQRKQRTEGGASKPLPKPSVQSSSPPCEHKRIIDDILGADGQKTGQTACAECGVILPVKLQGKPVARSS